MTLGRGDTVGTGGGRRESEKPPPPTWSLSFGRLKPPALLSAPKRLFIQRDISALPASGGVLPPPSPQHQEEGGAGRKSHPGWHGDNKDFHLHELSKRLW